MVITVLNEENTIGKLLESIDQQTRHPDEIVLVDGGSADNTMGVITQYLRERNHTTKHNQQKTDNSPIKILQKRGNRSVGRNEGIRKSSGDVIFITDAGCSLDSQWIEKIYEHFLDPKTEVVAGYYRGYSNTFFERALIPYVLVMEDNVTPDNFLPASRSMAFRKSVWKKIGGFPEQFSHNEDYVFAHKMKSENYKIIFEKSAIVYWIPPDNLTSAYTMFYRFALGDAQAKLWRPKVFLIFARYLSVGILLVIALTSGNYILIGLLLFFFIFYCLWAIGKNYRYVNHLSALWYLPLFQFTSDFAVLLGTTEGLFRQ